MEVRIRPVRILYEMIIDRRTYRFTMVSGIFLHVDSQVRLKTGVILWREIKGRKAEHLIELLTVFLHEHCAMPWPETEPEDVTEGP